MELKTKLSARQTVTGLIVGVAAAALFLHFLSASGDSSAASRKVVTSSYSDLKSAYEENSVRFKADHANDRYQLGGSVVSVDEGVIGAVTITVTDASGVTYWAIFDKVDPVSLKDLSRGDVVTFYCDSFTLGYPGDCVLTGTNKHARA